MGSWVFGVSVHNIYSYSTPLISQDSGESTIAITTLCQGTTASSMNKVGKDKPGMASVQATGIDRFSRGTEGKDRTGSSRWAPVDESSETMLTGTGVLLCSM